MNTPTIEAARAMGEEDGPYVEAERLAFEAWLEGHCWELGAKWYPGLGYLGIAEDSELMDPGAVQTRRMWAAWRDRAALASCGETMEQLKALDAERCAKINSYVIANARLTEERDADKAMHDTLRRCFDEWIKKTDWVQDEITNGTLSPKWRGHHRADAIKAEIDRLRAAK